MMTNVVNSNYARDVMHCTWYPSPVALEAITIFVKEFRVERIEKVSW